MSLTTSNLLAEWFPEVDQSAEFRAADSWLYSMPRARWPKKRQRFLINWFRRARKNYTGDIRAELNVGEGPVVPIGRSCAQCGRPLFFHNRLPANRKRIDPLDDGHAFVEAGQAVSA